MPAEAQHLPMPDGCILQRRNDGAVLVRVPSRRRQAAPLPDAVFTFRAGDPQFDFWHQQLAQQEAQQQ
ncbi:MAG TPA: hypothetical protein VFE46_14780 [Pirellulales bacterium]|jgi:hypothetical protein|nr:hypothetical protein [Pirellulales bacterium]